jgi:hypothetical protein
MAALADRDPLVTSDERDEDVSALGFTLDDYYAGGGASPDAEALPPGIDAALRSIFDDHDHDHGPAGSSAAPRQPVSALITRLELDLIEQVYRWTGHFPERTRPLLRHLTRRADALGLVYSEHAERTATVALTTLVATLAMNYVRRGSYVA